MSDDCCGKSIDTAVLEQSHRRVLLTVLAINVVSFVRVMVTGAVVSGSSSLLSGTLDNLGDAMTYALSFAVVGALRPPKPGWLTSRACSFLVLP
ncbi:MAG: hypothetical protein R3E86_22155 [Pseudomonadales bacterium]